MNFDLAWQFLGVPKRLSQWYLTHVRLLLLILLHRKLILQCLVVIIIIIINIVVVKKVLIVIVMTIVRIIIAGSAASSGENHRIRIGNILKFVETTLVIVFAYLKEFEFPCCQVSLIVIYWVKLLTTMRIKIIIIIIGGCFMIVVIIITIVIIIVMILLLWIILVKFFFFFDFLLDVFELLISLHVAYCYAKTRRIVSSVIVLIFIFLFLLLLLRPWTHKFHNVIIFSKIILIVILSIDIWSIIVFIEEGILHVIHRCLFVIIIAVRLENHWITSLMKLLQRI